MGIVGVKEFLRPARPMLGPVLGFPAPLVRGVVRAIPNGNVKRAFWQLIGNPISHGSWRFTAPTAFGFELHGNTVDFLDRYVYFFGVWEPNLSYWITQRLRPGDTFVDVGANIGYYTLLASRLVGADGRVVAVEASPRVFHRLERNLALNHTANVRAINVAVSDRPGEIELYDGPISNSGKTSILRASGRPRSGTIHAAPLAAILTDHEFASARIIKIDVEGAEWLVVSGLADVLGRTRFDAEFVIEVSPSWLASMQRRPEDIIDIFARDGFNAYTMINDYHSNSYVDGTPYAPPQRLSGPLTETCDIVFSRLDQREL